VHLLLKLLRDSGAHRKKSSPSGANSSRTLPQGRTFLLVRLALEVSQQLIPEISGNRLMVSVRLMRQGEDYRAQSVNDDVAFELALCS
jgi:cell division protein ZapD